MLLKDFILELDNKDVAIISEEPLGYESVTLQTATITVYRWSNESDNKIRVGNWTISEQEARDQGNGGRSVVRDLFTQ